MLLSTITKQLAGVSNRNVRTTRQHQASRLLRNAGIARAAENPATGVSYQHVMVAILDQDPYLSAGSKQAINTAADITNQNKSKLTVLVADEKGKAPPETRLQTLNWHLKEKGCPDYEVVEKVVESATSVLIGDVADELDADLMVVSADAVHSKQVDANLLAEFVPCPILILP